MKHQIHRFSDLPRHAFEKLVATWLTIVFLTVALGFVLCAGTAKSDVILSLPLVQKIYEPAMIRNFTPSPTLAFVQERCQTHLHPHHTYGITKIDYSSQTQRNAVITKVQMIASIKAYRHCVGKTTLDQLAQK
jgi:hypothetical protein